VPTLAGPASYALSETLGWKAGLGYPFRQAPAFYMVIALATLVGAGLNFIGIPPVSVALLRRRGQRRARAAFDGDDHVGR
jgi:hypothetical protein